MKIERRIREFLKTSGGDLPWPFGVRIDRELSPRGLVVFGSMGVVEKLSVSKFNPYKTERDQALLRWNLAGISQSVLSELSGLSRSTISRIILKMRKAQNGCEV